MTSGPSLSESRRKALGYTRVRLRTESVIALRKAASKAGLSVSEMVLILVKGAKR